MHRSPPIQAELDRAHALALELAKMAQAAIAESWLKARAWHKGGAIDWLTETDLDIEERVRQRLQRTFPHHRIVGEEYGASGPDQASHVWAIDPVDGTNNFAHGLPWCGFSLGLAIDGEPVVGVVVDPFRAVTYHAQAGSGAHANERRVSVVSPPDWAGELIVTELAGHLCWHGLPQLLRAASQRGAICRIMGSTALSMAQVASGAAMAVVFGAFDPVDSTAGLCLLREGGATTMNFQGVRALQPCGSLIAASSPVAEWLQKLLQPYGPGDQAGESS